MREHFSSIPAKYTNNNIAAVSTNDIISLAFGITGTLLAVGTIFATIAIQTHSPRMHFI